MGVVEGSLMMEDIFGGGIASTDSNCVEKSKKA